MAPSGTSYGGFPCAPALGLRLLQLPCPRALASRGAPAIEELKETFLRWVESQNRPSGRGVSADELPEASPVVPPEKTSVVPQVEKKPKEPSKRHPRPMEAARKLQRQTVVLPPKKPPIPDSTEALEAGRHRGAIRAVSAYAEVAAQSLARSTATRTFFALRLGTGSCRPIATNVSSARPPPRARTARWLPERGAVPRRTGSALRWRRSSKAGDESRSSSCK
jgi:hypothetical protein